MIFDPPNLAKSPLRSDSIKILTKGLLHYSRKGVRMPKFRNFYRTSPEISTFFSLFSYSVCWQGRRGPFPWLEDCECKRARPPRGQAWPHGRSWSWIRRFQLSLFGSLSVFIYWVHLIVIWQCPSGTEFGDNIVQFNFFSVHSVFQRTSGLRPKKYIEFQFISVSNLWGRAPQNLLTIFFWFLEKILSPKNSNFFFSILGQKTMQIDVILSQEYGKIVFLSKKKF